MGQALNDPEPELVKTWRRATPQPAQDREALQLVEHRTSPAIRVPLVARDRVLGSMAF